MIGTDRERTELQETGHLRLYGKTTLAEIIALTESLGLDPGAVKLGGSANISFTAITLEVEQ